MGHVYRQKGRHIWNLKYYQHGRPVYESARTENKNEALKILKQREGAIADGEELPIGRMRVDDALKGVVADYKHNARASASNLEYRIRLHLMPFFGGRYLRSLRSSDVLAYITERRDQQGASASTINRELAILKRAFTLAMRSRAITARPHIPMLKEHNARSGFFERDDLERLCAELPAPWRPVMRFAYFTGWRIRSEILPLTWDRVDPVVVRLEPGSTKNDSGREFPYAHTPPLVTLMDEQRQARPEGCPFVFPGASGRRLPSWYAGIWGAACQRAGLVGKIPHDFRRTAVRNLVRAGVSEKTAMILTGHKTRSVFDRYDIITLTDLQTAASKLS